MILSLNHYLYLSLGTSFLYGDAFCVSLYNPFIISSNRSSYVCNNFWWLANSLDDERKNLFHSELFWSWFAIVVWIISSCWRIEQRRPLPFKNDCIFLLSLASFLTKIFCSNSLFSGLTSSFCWSAMWLMIICKRGYNRCCNSRYINCSRGRKFFSHLHFSSFDILKYT